MRVIKKIYLIVSFILYYLMKLIQSNFILAYDILTPKMRTNPGFIWIDLRTKSDLGILLYSNLVSMTPGTISVDVTRNKKRMLVHYLYNDADNGTIRDLDKIQNKIIELTN